MTREHRRTGAPNRKPYLRKLERQGADLSWLTRLAHGEKLRANGSGLAKSDLTELKRRDVIKKAGKLIGKYIESMGGLGMKIELKRSKNAPYVWINSELRPLAAKALDRAMSYEVTPYDSEPFVVRLFRGGKNGGYFFPIGLTDVAQTILSQIGYETQFFAGQRPAKKFDLPGVGQNYGLIRRERFWRLKRSWAGV